MLILGVIPVVALARGEARRARLEAGSMWCPRRVCLLRLWEVTRE